MDYHRTVVFQPCAWSCCDAFEVNAFQVHVFGRMQDGRAVHVRLDGFRPFVLLRIDDPYFNHEAGKRYIQKLKQEHRFETTGLLPNVCFVNKTPLFPYVSDTVNI
jgi:hypothetical protein